MLFISNWIPFQTPANPPNVTSSVVLCHLVSQLNGPVATTRWEEKLHYSPNNKKNTDGRMIKNYRTAMTFVLRAHAGLSLQTPHTLCILNYRICDALLLLTAGLHVPGRRLGLQLGLIKTERQFIVLSMALPVGVQTEYGVNSRKPDFRAWKSCYVSGFQADRRFVTEG